jgi:putative cardiolipin synthase
MWRCSLLAVRTTFENLVEMQMFSTITQWLWAAGARGISALVAAAFLGGCASLSERGPVSVTHAFSPDVLGPLGKLVQASTPADTPVEHSGFRLLHDGAHALDARVSLANAARRSLDVQYYILSCDVSGMHFASALHAAAERACGCGS